MGFEISHDVDARDLFTAGFGDIVAEVPDWNARQSGIDLYGNRTYSR